MESLEIEFSLTLFQVEENGIRTHSSALFSPHISQPLWSLRTFGRSTQLCANARWNRPVGRDSLLIPHCGWRDGGDTISVLTY